MNQVNTYKKQKKNSQAFTWLRSYNDFTFCQQGKLIIENKLN